ncbi:hypothetical protein [Streptomyces millisiae]|uniref:Uncharacterized protein n=1 Tax=Streptomyces millisiae TaxID=3075542 RepID=A0ABU2LXD1_9ACTN|nr:hypothetical protein [Streptomyces sp. DSM 44918]MDT0322253.1 hypothetical protein [Streptomyces sp. DSM 44918]
MVVIGARAADSRQGAVARFAPAKPERAAGAVHHLGRPRPVFAAVIEAVRAAADGAVVDSMPVMQRDGAAVYRNERLPSGR